MFIVLTELNYICIIQGQCGILISLSVETRNAINWSKLGHVTSLASAVARQC